MEEELTMSNTLGPTVTYPYALDKHGARVGVDSLSGAAYYCIGCGQPMVARTNEFEWRRKAKHFAHKKENPNCSRMSILHTDTQRCIVDSFNDAVRTGGEYHVGTRCRPYQHETIRNLAVKGAVAESEQSVVSGTRSDVVIWKADGNPVAIEVVASEGGRMSWTTRQAYVDSGIPVLSLDVIGLKEPPEFIRKKVVVLRDSMLPEAPCRRCKEIAEEREAQLKRERLLHEGQEQEKRLRQHQQEQEERLRQQGRRAKSREWWAREQQKRGAMPGITCKGCGAPFGYVKQVPCQPDSRTVPRDCLFDEASQRAIRQLQRLEQQGDQTDTP